MMRALGAAEYSDYRRVNIGAAVYDRDRMLTHGWNQARSHTIQKLYNDKAGRVAPDHYLHAEMHCIVREKRGALVGADMYVGRLDMTGMPAMCKPCPACELAIREAGIKRVFYTTPTGVEVLNVG